MKPIKRLLTILFVSTLLLSCDKEEATPSEYTDQTVFVYMPWSNNLTSYFEQNILDIESALLEKASENERVVLFFASTSSTATLTEMHYFKGDLLKTELRTYDVSTFTTAEGITSLINEVKAYAPAASYAMTISSHGMAWVPAEETKAKEASDQKEYWEYEGVPLTRYFGGTSAAYQINIATFAEGVKATGTVMEYILFDDCYMSNIEAAYDLREVANYLIASPTEVMAYGFPYATIGKYLLGDVNYEAISNGFYDFYSTYTYPYGTIGVVDCSEIDSMAVLMRQINKLESTTTANSSVQRMCGYTPTLFFDFGDYVNHNCNDSILLAQFNTQLERMMPYRAHTEQYYSMSSGAVSISSYSGITTSESSTNSKAASLESTAWYIATH